MHKYVYTVQAEKYNGRCTQLRIQVHAWAVFGQVQFVGEITTKTIEKFYRNKSHLMYFTKPTILVANSSY